MLLHAPVTDQKSWSIVTVSGIVFCPGSDHMQKGRSEVLDEACGKYRSFAVSRVKRWPIHVITRKEEDDTITTYVCVWK
jgi:hypothetical protein